MSAKDCLRRNEEGFLPLTRDEVSESAEERWVRPSEARAGDVALEDDELVA